MNWIICGFMEVNMGDAADESMKTHISKRRSNDDYNVLGHPTFLKVYAIQGKYINEVMGATPRTSIQPL